MTVDGAQVVWFSELGSGDVARVGGKNASLGEMISRLQQAGINVPPGFATTADAYWRFLKTNRLDQKITAQLDRLRESEKSLEEVGRNIRQLIIEAEFPRGLADEIKEGYRQLAAQSGREDVDVAVRSSATAEDLPQASFAGQQESYLNVSGEEAVLRACQSCYASLFTDRAIAYRERHGFDHMKVALSAGVQRMVRSDKAGAGVMFSIDTETGFPEMVLINGAWGLGETVVQGKVDPDEYMVFKPLLKEPGLQPVVEKVMGSKTEKMIYGGEQGVTTRTVATDETERFSFVLSDEEILQLGRWAQQIEDHYGMPMDIEWAKDGETGTLYIVQARPETVQSRKESGALKQYTLKSQGERWVTGLAIGDAIADGRVCKLHSAAEMDRFPENGILVTEMTDPDWVPVMKRAAAIITDHGGRTSHAAIVSRELGLPAIVGTGNGTQALQSGQPVTVSCAEGDQGAVYKGILDYEVQDVALENIPRTQTKVMLNLANPAASLRWWRLPSDGVGLARMEFIINNIIKVHPMALVHYDNLADERAKQQIASLTRGWSDKQEYFVRNLAYGIGRIAASQYPKPVIVRMSDFKTNEYADLIGGEQFEPSEGNPMLGWRGASRYYSEGYREGFALECRAIRIVREEMGFHNVVVMIPFCRTLKEADRVLEVMAEQGLRRGENGLEVYVMCEIPSNVILAGAYSDRFDGFSIGSNDLTQLALGVDRDSSELAHLFSEEDETVQWLIQHVIEWAHQKGRKVGLCGQAPSDHPQFARFLVQSGIDSISVSPDSFISVKRTVAETEETKGI